MHSPLHVTFDFWFWRRGKGVGRRVLRTCVRGHVGTYLVSHRIIRFIDLQACSMDDNDNNVKVSITMTMIVT